MHWPAARLAGGRASTTDACAPPRPRQGERGRELKKIKERGDEVEEIRIHFFQKKP
jgi:hypothetical protein